MCGSDHHDDHNSQPFTLESRRAVLLGLGIAFAGSVAASAARAGLALPGVLFQPTPGIDLIKDETAHAMPMPLVATRNDILGPFWRPGAPFSSKLIPPGATGQKLVLSGTVMDTGGKPVPNVIMDFWNADKDGVYDIKNPSQALDPSEFKYRGLLKTDDKGSYQIETVVPGRYKIPGHLPGFETFDGVLRPSHVHVMTSHNGTVPLITQIYFEGDDAIPNDPWAAKSKNIAILDKSAATWRTTFDIVLLRFE